MRTSINRPQGRLSLFAIDQHGNWERLCSRCNTVTVDWGFIAAKCLGHGDADYRVKGMYFEFENVASPGDAVTVPSFDEFSGIAYYNGLSASSDRDFVRTELIGLPTIDVETGFEDYFGSGEGNLLSSYAQTSGATGVHGKTFSNAANSKVFGAALVATPVWADRTQDKIFARAYFSTGDQVLKAASGQIGIRWDMPFTV